MKIVISIHLLFLSIFSFSQDETKPNTYSIGPLLSVECFGGWESDCWELRELYFKQTAKNTYIFSNSIGFHYITSIKMNLHESHEFPATVKVRQRFIMA